MKNFGLFLSFTILVVMSGCNSCTSDPPDDLFWDFNHVTEYYDTKKDTRSLEFCESRLTNQELDTLELVLSLNHTKYKREENKIMVLKKHVPTIDQMWAIDDELRSRMKNKNLGCPQYVEY